MSDFLPVDQRVVIVPPAQDGLLHEDLLWLTGKVCCPGHVVGPMNAMRLALLTGGRVVVDPMLEIQEVQLDHGLPMGSSTLHAIHVPARNLMPIGHDPDALTLTTTRGSHRLTPTT